jgi:predicted outer membrane protein
MINIFSIRSVVLASTLALMVACGDDDDDNSTSTGGSRASGGSSAQGGTGGRNNTGGSATAGTGGRLGTGGSVTGTGGIHTGGNNNTGGRETAGAGGEGALDQGGQGGSAGAEGGSSGNAGGGAGGAAGDAGAGGGGGAGGGASLEALSDAQIFMVLDTLNDGEVEEAYAALPRLTNDDIKAFAQQMITDHSMARQDTATLADSLSIVPSASDTQEALKEEASDVIEEFSDSTATSLDTAYINSQVDAHAHALLLLDELHASAEATALQQFLTTLHSAVQTHYDMAVTLRSAL